MLVREWGVQRERLVHLRSLRPSAQLRGLGLALALTFAVGARAETASVEMRLRGESSVEARGILTAKAMDGRGAPVGVAFTCGAKPSCTAQLEVPQPASEWLLSVEATGYWVWPAIVPSGGAVDLWPAGTLIGQVDTRTTPQDVSELAVRFTSSPGSTPPTGFPEEGVVTCPVVDGKLSCVLPAGTFDLRLRAKGFSSVYLWAKRIETGSALQVGSLSLKRGASLVGRVVSNERDAPKPGACTVRLEPVGVVGGKGSSAADSPQVGVDGRGFFHLEALPPGRWSIVAEQVGFAPVRRAVTILEGAEANLKEPLFLSRPARLELSFFPPQDPDGKPWMVELLESMDDGRAAPIATAPASLGGFWARAGLSSGRRYMVRVRTSAGHVWWADAASFELAGPVHKRAQELGIEEVTGSLRLGEQPLAGRMTFGAPEENLAIELRSDSDGLFSGLLPRVGTWIVRVASETPSIRRRVEVDVRRGLDGKGKVDILLSDRALTGEIVDEKGAHLERAILTVRGGGDSRESVQDHVEGGLFRLTGFEPGEYLLKAVGGGRISEMVPVEVAPDGTSPFVRIVAKPRVVIDLRLVTEVGTPIPGARVDLLLPTQFPGLSSRSGRTDALGRISFPTHPDVAQQCLAVSEPGLPHRVFAVVPGPDVQDVVVATAGGTIEIETASPRDGDAQVLWHGPCFLPTPLVRRWTGGDGTRFPGMAPGEYRLCRHRGGSPVPLSCAAGFLAPYGTISLSLPAAR